MQTDETNKQTNKQTNNIDNHIGVFKLYLSEFLAQYSFYCYSCNTLLFILLLLLFFLLCVAVYRHKIHYLSINTMNIILYNPDIYKLINYNTAWANKI